MADRESVKVINAALDETPQGEIVLRGVIDPDSLGFLQVDDYQREILSKEKIRKLKKALMRSRVPDIDLGMRGQRCREVSGSFYLQDPVYIVDGLQRVSAAQEMLLDESCEVIPHLGAVIHFGTNEEWERERFEDLNVGQTGLSGNVTLRNKRVTVPAMDALYKLSGSEAFVLTDKICWQQQMRRGNDLLTATTLVKVVGRLHGHAGPGSGSNVIELANGLQKIMDNVGRATFIQNIRLFFDVVDQAWGIRRVAYRQGAPFLKATFLITLAKVLSDHVNFWDGDKLVVDKSVVNKLAQFPVDDPELMRLASSSGMAADTLYWHFVKHINSGRRTRRLQLRRGMYDSDIEEFGEED